MPKRKLAALRYASRVAYKRRRVVRRAARYSGRGLGVAVRGLSRYGLAAGAAAVAGYGAYRFLRGRRKRIMGSKHATGKSARRYVFGDRFSEETLSVKTMNIREVRMVRGENESVDSMHRTGGGGYKLKGFSICGTFRVGFLSGATSPVVCNMMLIQFKDDTPNAVDEWWLNFFKNSDPQQGERHVNFINRTGILDSAGLTPVGVSPPDDAWDQQQMCQPLNPDKFNVVMRRKFTLYPRTSTDVISKEPGKQHFYKIDTYVKAGTNFVYETQDSLSPVRPIYVMVWYETMFSRSRTANQPVVVNLSVVGYTEKLKGT